VLETLLILDSASLMEIVHIHLSDEGAVVVVFEVLWQHLSCELIRVIYYETFA
jgi:hypothetical protein